MIDLTEVGAHATLDATGVWQLRFGIDLPDIAWNRGYTLQLRIIHEADQFIHQHEPRALWMDWVDGSPLDRWTVSFPLVRDRTDDRFGDDGRYLYRYQLFGPDGRAEPFWFADPFARESGIGDLSALTADRTVTPFQWTDAAYRTPGIDEMVVYEVDVREFNVDLDDLRVQLDYIAGLGVNVLELMPISNVRESVEWGYTPLGYFSPDERLGGPQALKRLVDAAHASGMGVILDSVYAHAHPDFAYDLVYRCTGEPSPMIGRFAGEFFTDRFGTDYGKAFTRDFFFELNRFLLDEFHIDGFRYDYVPGYYDGPAGTGYAELVFRTHALSAGYARFARADGTSGLIQCAEYLDDPRGVLSQTYSNACWQDRLLFGARDVAQAGRVSADFAHLLDPGFIGYPSSHDANGDVFPVAPFQYLESHDHRRFIDAFGITKFADLLGEPFGDRSRYYKTQPFVIALYTAKGIPMLWQGQEFAENWGLPEGGFGKILYERPLHWEYFYDTAGKALVRLYRLLGALRRSHRALGSRGFFYYYADAAHLAANVIAYRRRADAAGASPDEDLVVFLNFGDVEARVTLPFPTVGTWVERIDGTKPPVQVLQAGAVCAVDVPSNYGSIYERT